MMNSKNFNSQQYERYLSTFGKEVLQNLVKLLEERNECNKIQVRGRYTYCENKRILNFTDSHISPSVTVCQQNALVNESHDNIFVKNKLPCRDVKGIKSPIITPSHGLLEAAVEDEVTAEGHKCIAINNDAVHLTGTFITKSEECSSNGIVSDNIGTVLDPITWDHIFDTQLLNDLNILDTESNINARKPQAEKGNFLQPIAEYENDICYNEVNIKPTKSFDLTKNINLDSKNMLHHFTVAQKIDDLPKNVKVETNIYENADIKKSKMKRLSSDMITNVIAKKPKNPQAKVSKKLFRKQKYTKVVKTWLTTVEHENLDHVLELQKNKETNTKEIILEANKLNEKKNTKKTVQAQLTNKGGVMKFGKPKQNELSAKPKDIVVTTETNVNTKVREKKAKSRFIAPIKSQPQPVNNIYYNIKNINDDNFKEHVTELSGVNDKEISMVLIFSNGFCQLTSRMDDTFVVEGTMFEINDVIYYWKHIYTSFWTMERIINHNTIVCYGGKNLLKYFASHIDVINTEVKVLDLQIGGNLVDPNKPPENFTNLQRLLCCVPEYTTTTECVQQKCAWHLAMLRECFGKLRSLLIDYDLWKVFLEIEMRVLPIVADMELRGVRVDTELLESMAKSLERRMKETELACHAAAGRVFQVNSALQVRTILYEELRLDARSNVRIKETLCKGDKSTSESVLRSLMAVHPLPKLILEYRHVHKAHATFVAGIANQVKDGVVRPTWEQTAAVTGRIACNNPNLQEIPKAPFSLALFPPDTTEEERCKESSGSSGRSGTFNFRSVYIPREGRVLLAADFKHIECRVFAYAAADTGLLHALASPDLFRVLAAKWLNKSEEDVGPEDRERTKRIVYASLYGAGSGRLMEILGVGYERALAVAAGFDGTFPSLKRFGRAVVAQCERRGGRLATLCGRGRSFERMFSGDAALRAQAERQAINFIVQGSAADLCKMAMVETARRLPGARLLLQIHDELVWEVERRDAPAAAAIIKSAMEGVGGSCGLAVTLPVAISVGRSWGDMEELTVPPLTPAC